MQLANRFQLNRSADHFVVTFASSSSGDLSDNGERIVELAIPLTVGIELALQLFDGMLRSLYDLNVQVNGLQERMNGLTRLAAEFQAKAVALAAEKTAATQEAAAATQGVINQ